MPTARVIVHSETGFTKAYAQWIAEDLDIEAYGLPVAKLVTWKPGDVAIFGSPVHGGELAEKKRIHRAAAAALTGGAHVIVFATGITPLDSFNEAALRENSALTDERISFFYVLGGFDASKLSPASKTLISLYRLMMNHRTEADASLALLLERTSHTCDFTDRTLIDPLVKEARSALAA